MYKLVVCDIDGTLVDSKGKISSVTLNTIKKVRAKGVNVTVCTGRNITKTLPIAKKLGLKIPFVCIDGIIFYDPVAKKPVKSLSLDMAEVRELVEIGENRRTFIEVSDGYKYYKYFPDKDFLKYDFFNKHDFIGRIKSWFGGIRYVKTVDELYNLTGPVYQVVLGADTEITEEIAETVRKKGYENIDVRDFLWKEYLFINYKGIGKAQGVELLCDYFGITPKEVIAFGDEMNDLDMLEYVGMGIAMENAAPEVKKIARRVTLSNDNNGVAYALKKLILDRK